MHNYRMIFYFQLIIFSELLLSLYVIFDDGNTLYFKSVYLAVVFLTTIIYFFLKNKWGFWKNSLFMFYSAFFIYSIIYYFIVESLKGTVFVNLNNNESFIIVYYTFIALTVCSVFTIDKFQLRDDNNVHSILKVSLTSIALCYLIELMFIYPILSNYSLFAHAASRIEVEEIISPLSFPYIKQLVTGVLIYQTIYFLNSKLYKNIGVKLLILPLYIMCLFLLLKLGMRKELLIIIVATLIFYAHKINDKKLILMSFLVVAALLLLGDIRQGNKNEDSINIINVLGEFFFSHSTLPFIISNNSMMDNHPIPYLNALYVFFPKFIVGTSPEVALSFSEMFKNKITGFSGMGFGFSPLAEATLISKYFPWIIFSSVCLCYSMLIKKLFKQYKIIAAILLSTIPNFMRVDFRSYFIETLVIIFMMIILVFLSKIKVGLKNG